MDAKYKKYAILVGVGFILGVWFSATVYLILRQAKPSISRAKHTMKKLITLPARKPRNNLIISDFESSSDLSKWAVVSARINASSNHPTSGRESAKLQYYPAKGAAVVKIERFFEGNKRFGDWRGYSNLKFDLYNPTENNTRLILQIKDADGTRYKRNIYLAPKEVTKVEIGIDELKDILDVSNIRQFNLFMWNPKKDFVCYLDNVRLEIGAKEGTRNKGRNNNAKISSGAAFLKKTSGVIMLSDFEKEANLSIWRKDDASISLTDAFHTHGAKGAKVIMKGRVKCPKVLIDRFLETKEGKRFGDWRGYSNLKFDLYNPTENNTRLILQIKDADGTRYKRNIYLAPKEVTKVEIGIDELKELLDVSNIRQFNLFRWEPKDSFTFYIDNLRVEKEGAGASVGIISPVLAKENNSEEAGVGGLNGGYLLGVENNIDKVFKDKNKFKGKWQDSYSIYCARNEYEGFQIALYSPDKPLRGVRVEIGDFTREGDSVKFDKGNIKWYVVKFVKTKRPDYTVSYAGWIPDPIIQEDHFDVPRGEIQPILVSFYASKDTKPGVYTGYVKIMPKSAPSKVVKVTMRVWDFTLPKRMHLKTAFDDYPWRLKFGHQYLKNLSGSDYRRELRNLNIDYHLKMLEYRISPILNLSLEDLNFPNELKLYLKYGLNAFAIGKYNGSNNNNWPKDDSALRALIPQYQQFAYRLRQLGVFDLSYVYTFDEPKVGDPFVDRVCRIIHEADPNLKNLVVLHDIPNIKAHNNWFKDIDIVCVRNVGLSKYLTDRLKAMGKEIWIYVSGPSYPYPTLVIDFKGIMYRIIPWSAWRYGADGLLYWCVDYWTKNPWDDPMNTKWGQNGNGSLFYPGDKKPLGSIRLEILRDGIEDYEYLYILSEEINRLKTQPKHTPTDTRRVSSGGVSSKDGDSSDSELLEEARKLLNIEDVVRTAGDYTKDSSQLLKRRRRIGDMIEKLNNLIH